MLPSRIESAVDAQKTYRQEERLGTLLIVSVVVTAALYFIPHARTIAYPLLLLSTYAHEMGHGVAALLAGGAFDSFVMFADGSGVAMMRIPPTRFAAAFSSAGGLLGPPIVAAILFAFATRRRWAGAVLWTIGALSTLTVLLWVRSAFGVFFVLSFAALVVAFARWAKPVVQQFVVIFLATQLGLSVFSRGDYLFTASARTAKGEMPSDVQQIANALVGPYWLWGALIALISVLVLGLAIRFYAKTLLEHHDAATAAKAKTLLR